MERNAGPWSSILFGHWADELDEIERINLRFYETILREILERALGSREAGIPLSNL